MGHILIRRTFAAQSQPGAVRRRALSNRVFGVLDVVVKRSVSGGSVSILLCLPKDDRRKNRS